MYCVDVSRRKSKLISGCKQVESELIARIVVIWQLKILLKVMKFKKVTKPLLEIKT